MTRNIFIYTFLILILSSSVFGFFETSSRSIIVNNNLYNTTVNLTELYINGTLVELGNYVPYTGATGNVDLGTYVLTAEEIHITKDGNMYKFSWEGDYPGIYAPYGDLFFGNLADQTTYFNYYKGKEMLFGYTGNLQTISMYGTLYVHDTLTINANISAKSGGANLKFLNPNTNQGHEFYSVDNLLLTLHNLDGANFHNKTIYNANSLKFATDNVAVGTGTSTGDRSITIGGETAFPMSNNKTLSILIGHRSTVSDRSISMGWLTDVTGTYGIGLGYDAEATGLNAIAIGTNTHANSPRAIAIGFDAEAMTGANNPTAVGAYSKATGNYATAYGSNAQATQTSSVAVGYNARATGGFGAVAVGTSSLASGGSAFAMGYLSEATTNALAGGTSAKATGSGSIALGYATIGSGIYSISIGGGTTTLNSSQATGRNAIALGGANALTSHNGAIASNTNSICIGAGCVNNVANEMKIGGVITSVLIEGNLTTTNLNVTTGWSGNCINTSVTNGIITGCND